MLLTEKFMKLIVREMRKNVKNNLTQFSVFVLLKQDKDFPRVDQAVAQVMPSGKVSGFYLRGTRLESLPDHRICSLRDYGRFFAFLDYLTIL
jgi:hypothetical protein